MVERVTIEQIKEAILAKESAKCAYLVHEYVEQNPYIKQKIVEKIIGNYIDGKIGLGDSITITVKKEDLNEKDSL